MHYIQRQIFSKLRYAEALSYSQMRPEGVESNHFAYHLEQMISDGLVEKIERKYTLTTQGQVMADRSSHRTVSVRTQPHIVVAPLITNGNGQDLLYKHSFQPYLNLYGPPQGRLDYYDENIAKGAARELKEKTGLSDVPMRHRGIVYVTANKGEARITKMLIHVFSGEVEGVPELSKPTIKGSSLWGNADKFTVKQCMPGYKQIRKLLNENDELFFEEITTKM